MTDPANPTLLSSPSFDMTHQWYQDLLFLFADADDVGRADVDYNDGSGELKVKVEFKIEDLLGKDSGATFTGLDVTLIETMLSEAGATSIEIKRFEIKDDEIKIEFEAQGIYDDEAHVLEQFAVMPLGLTIADQDGHETASVLHVGSDGDLVKDMAEADLGAMMESYSDYLEAADLADTADPAGHGDMSDAHHADIVTAADAGLDLGDYGPSACSEIVDSFLDYDPDRDIPDRLMMTEDVWFGEARDEADYKLCKDDEDLSKMEWDYSRGGEKLTLEVEFKTAGLFGENAPQQIVDLDLSEVEEIMAGLNATEITVTKFEIDADRVRFEVEGHGISITDDEVYALPPSVSFPITVQDGEGTADESTLELCVEKFDPHSPVSFDLNWDGEISTTGVSTAMDRADGEIGQTVAFDIDADGTKENIEWLDGSGDGLLIDNRDGNAAEDMDGARLFGDEGGKYVNGYQKMSQLLDANQDGVVAGDELEGLEFWVDDGDAVVEDGELVSVTDFGVSEIATGYCLDENDRGEFLMKSLAVIEGADFPDPSLDPGPIIDGVMPPEENDWFFPDPIIDASPYDDVGVSSSFPLPLLPPADETDFGALNDEEPMTDDELMFA